MSSLKGSPLDVVGGLREQITEGDEDLLADAHEDYVGHWLICLVLFVLWAVEERLEDYVGFQVVQDLVVAKVAVFGQIQDGALLDIFVILVIIHFNEALPDEVHFFDITLVTNDAFAGGGDTAVHLDDELIGEASLALLEEVVEGSLEFFEDTGVLDQVRLHLRGNLLIELELFDNQVEIIEESLLNILSDIVVQGRLDVEGFVRFLDFLDPHVQGVQLLLDEVVEIIRGIEDTVDGAHEEREEGEAQELKADGENVLVRSFTGVVTVADCCDDLEDPVEGENVLSNDRFGVEFLGVHPGLGAVVG